MSPPPPQKEKKEKKKEVISYKNGKKEKISLFRLNQCSLKLYIPLYKSPSNGLVTYRKRLGKEHP